MPKLYCIASKQPGNDLHRFLGVDCNPDDLPTCHGLRTLFVNNGVRITRIQGASSAAHKNITVDMTNGRADTWAAACELQVPSCGGFVTFERKARHPQSTGFVRSNRALNRRSHMRRRIAIGRLVVTDVVWAAISGTGLRYRRSMDLFVDRPIRDG